MLKTDNFEKRFLLNFHALNLEILERHWDRMSIAATSFILSVMQSKTGTRTPLSRADTSSAVIAT